jgi:hypothetical protein
MPSVRIAAFDTWRQGYALASVSVLQAGTSVPALIFSDEALTQPLTNPVTLVQKTDAQGNGYGKFAQPIYVGVPFYLQINSIDTTGVERPPLTTLDGQDAQDATVIVTGGTQANSLDDMLARRIDVRDYGPFLSVGAQGASSSTNNATLVSALGVAGAASGGYVELPAGFYQVTNFTIPQGTVMRGQGRGATTLQSNAAGKVATIGGVRAGISRLTLDGISLVTNSIGLFAANIDQIVIDDAEIKRFDTGIYCQGGLYSDWRELWISNCNTGYKCYGENALGLGSARSFNRWYGGNVDTCTTVGVDIKNVDLVCLYNLFQGIDFDTNTGTAVSITSARFTTLRDCEWNSNIADLAVADKSPSNPNSNVIGLEVFDCSLSTGTISIVGNAENIVFKRSILDTVTVTLTAPAHNIVVEDCLETNTAIGGTATAWTRKKSDGRGQTFGLTTGNAATEAWHIVLKSGQKVYLEAKVVGRQRNGINTGFYHFAISAGRPGATLLYDTQTANYTVGNVLTGGTSGATARITADSDSGTTGTLTLQDIVGTFQDDETITDGAGGSALVNGTLSESTAAVIGSEADIRADQETNANWDAAFAANGNQIELRVTGDTSQTVEWTVDVDAVIVG